MIKPSAYFLGYTVWHVGHSRNVLANESRRYMVTLPLIGRTHTQNDAYTIVDITMHFILIMQMVLTFNHWTPGDYRFSEPNPNKIGMTFP